MLARFMDGPTRLAAPIAPLLGCWILPHSVATLLVAARYPLLPPAYQSPARPAPLPRHQARQRGASGF